MLTVFKINSVAFYALCAIHFPSFPTPFFHSSVTDQQSQWRCAAHVWSFDRLFFYSYRIMTTEYWAKQLLKKKQGFVGSESIGKLLPLAASCLICFRLNFCTYVILASMIRSCPLLLVLQLKGRVIDWFLYHCHAYLEANYNERYNKSHLWKFQFSTCWQNSKQNCHGIFIWTSNSFTFSDVTVGTNRISDRSIRERTPTLGNLTNSSCMNGFSDSNVLGC